MTHLYVGCDILLVCMCVRVHVNEPNCVYIIIIHNYVWKVIILLL